MNARSPSRATCVPRARSDTCSPSLESTSGASPLTLPTRSQRPFFQAWVRVAASPFFFLCLVSSLAFSSASPFLGVSEDAVGISLDLRATTENARLGERDGEGTRGRRRMKGGRREPGAGSLETTGDHPDRQSSPEVADQSGPTKCEVYGSRVILRPGRVGTC